MEPTKTPHGELEGCTAPTGSEVLTVRLDQLPSGSRAVVCDLHAPDDDLHRLMAMGVCLGREIQMVQIGNPLIIAVHGSRIGLSARLASRISVRPVAPNSSPGNHS